MSTRSSISPPPRSLRRARLDNLALVPGNLLPLKTVYQATANRLPENAILIVLPLSHGAQTQTMLEVAKLLAQNGHQVRVLPAEEFSRGVTHG